MCYIKGTFNHGFFYLVSNDFHLVGYSDIDWGEDLEDWKNIIRFTFYLDDTTFTWVSKKQPMVALSTYEAEYVVASSCVCHAIW